MILSGWLVYPFTSIDLFDVDFKIPKGVADYDSREIQVWGRGYSDVTRYEESIWNWLPDWVRSLDLTDKGFLILALTGLLILVVLITYAVIKKKKDMTDYLHITSVLAICFLFWLCSAPLIRYGCVFLWLVPVLTWGFVYTKISPGTDRYKLYLVLLILAGVYKLGAFGAEVFGNGEAAYLVLQKDYENYETESYEVNGYTFYYPVEGDRTGYNDFPSVPVKKEVTFRGDDLKDGFLTRE